MLFCETSPGPLKTHSSIPLLPNLYTAVIIVSNNCIFRYFARPLLTQRMVVMTSHDDGRCDDVA